MYVRNQFACFMKTAIVTIETKKNNDKPKIDTSKDFREIKFILRNQQKKHFKSLVSVHDINKFVDKIVIRYAKYITGSFRFSQSSVKYKFLQKAECEKSNLFYEINKEKHFKSVVSLHDLNKFVDTFFLFAIQTM